MYNLSWQTRSDSVDSRVRHEMAHRLGHALDRFQGDIERIQVRLEDLNGPRGGIDKEVRIDLALRGARDLTVTQRAGDWSAAVQLAAGRLGRNVARQLDRRKDRQTRGRSLFGRARRSRVDQARQEAERFEATQAVA